MKKTAKHKYAMIGFVYLLGLICASFLDSLVCFLLFLAAALAFLCLNRNNGGFPVVCVAVVAFSFLVMGVYNLLYAESACRLDGMTCLVTGTVTEVLSPDNDTVMLSVSGTAENTPVKFTLFAMDTGIKTGDVISFPAKFQRLTDSAEFSQTSYYYTKGIFLCAYARDEIQIVSESVSPQSFVTGISDYFKGKTEQVLSRDECGIIKAMFFGDKSGLSHKLSVTVKRAGIAHLTAVSGAHLSLIVHFMAMIFSKIIKRKNKMISVCFIGCVVFLMLFFGMTASVMRSGFMLCLVYSAQLFNRRSNVLNSVGAALIAILVFAPYACRDIGLWLSVLGTLGVSVVSSNVSSFICIKFRKNINRVLVAGICAFMCTMPVGALCFGGVSLVSFLTGIVVAPLFSVILILVLLSVLSFGILSYPLMLVAGSVAKLMNIVINFVGGFRYAYIETENETLLVFFVLLAFALIATLLVSRRKRYIVRLMTASFLTLAIASLAVEIICFNSIKLSVYSDGKDGLLTVEDKKGVSFFALSDSSRISNKIEEYSIGKNKSLLCVAGITENNSDIDTGGFAETYLPLSSEMEYDINGEYTARISDNGIFLDIRGIKIALLSINSADECDIGIYCGYSKNLENKGNSATILCDKRFYNSGDELNAYYYETKIVINEEGMYSLGKGRSA